MAINPFEATQGFHDLLRHKGHDIVCVCYGDPKDPHNVALECETCGEVLIDFDAPDDDDAYEQAGSFGGDTGIDADDPNLFIIDEDE